MTEHGLGKKKKQLSQQAEGTLHQNSILVQTFAIPQRPNPEPKVAPAHGLGAGAHCEGERGEQGAGQGTASLEQPRGKHLPGGR